MPQLGPLARQRSAGRRPASARARPGRRRRPPSGGRPRARSTSSVRHGQLGRVEPVAVQPVAVVTMLDPVTPEHRAQAGSSARPADLRVALAGLPGHRVRRQDVRATRPARRPGPAVAARAGAFLLPSACGSMPSTPKSLSTRTRQRLHAGIQMLPRAPGRPGQCKVHCNHPRATQAHHREPKENHHDRKSGAKELPDPRRDPDLRLRRPGPAADRRGRDRAADPAAGLALVRSRQAARGNRTAARRRISSTTCRARCTS